VLDLAAHPPKLFVAIEPDDLGEMEQIEASIAEFLPRFFLSFFFLPVDNTSLPWPLHQFRGYLVPANSKTPLKSDPSPRNSVTLIYKHCPPCTIKATPTSLGLQCSHWITRMAPQFLGSTLPKKM
jgi:hypothetical protein